MKYDGRFYQMEKIEQKSHDTPESHNEHIVMLRKDAQEKLAKTENACYACTANGGIERECCLDNGRKDLCWIDNQPNRKEDCKYWELIESE